MYSQVSTDTLEGNQETEMATILLVPIAKTTMQFQIDFLQQDEAQYESAIDS